jgi:hypothetical protein
MKINTVTRSEFHWMGNVPRGTHVEISGMMLREENFTGVGIQAQLRGRNEVIDLGLVLEDTIPGRQTREEMRCWPLVKSLEEKLLSQDEEGAMKLLRNHFLGETYGV